MFEKNPQLTVPIELGDRILLRLDGEPLIKWVTVIDIKNDRLVGRDMYNDTFELTVDNILDRILVHQLTEVERNKPAGQLRSKEELKAVKSRLWNYMHDLGLLGISVVVDEQDPQSEIEIIEHSCDMEVVERQGMYSLVASSLGEYSIQLEGSQGKGDLN